MYLDRLLTGLGWRAESRPTKFLAYFQLVEACARPGCPVCRCLREGTVRSLGALLYEQVTDPATRSVLDASWGFCAWHARMAANEVKNAALGMAIIYEDVLSRLRERLRRARDELTSPRLIRGWRRLFHRPAPVNFVAARESRRRCPLCADLAGFEASYLLTLLEFVEDGDFERRYRRSAGVCLPHLTRALEFFPGHPGAASLVARTIEKLDRLARELHGFIDKHDHRKQAPFTDEEAASWTSAIEVLAGQSELFGNEMPQGQPRSQPPPEAMERARADPPGSESELRERLQHLSFEKGRLELRLQDLMRQLGDESSRAAALHYRLWSTDEDRKVLEMNLAGERSATRTWRSVVRDLRAEIEDLKTRLARYERRPDDAA